jgi:hypothetical protein
MIPLGQEDIDLFRTMNVSRKIADILNIVREWHRKVPEGAWLAMDRDLMHRLKRATEAQWPTPKPPTASDLVQKAIDEGKTADETIRILCEAGFIDGFQEGLVNE